MIDLSPHSKIALTGAGGWLGTELLEALTAQLGGATVRSSVVCFGSRDRTLTLSDGTKHRIYNLANDFPDTEFRGVVHLAFQTRDKVAVLGSERYCFENLQITSRAIQLIEQSRLQWVATVSSGAVLSFPGGPLESDVLANPYGFAKRIEEKLLESVATDIGANLAIGRLWGAMGRFMPPNPAYAVSDFITAGLAGEAVNVTAERKVFRRYVDAGEFMNVLVTIAQHRPRCAFDSGGHLVELGELAALVAEKLETTVACRELNPHLADNTYFYPGNEFELLAKELEISLSPLHELVEKTILNHRSS
jgi:nucleoside-diphosphate-sugar epimerase